MTGFMLGSWQNIVYYRWSLWNSNIRWELCMISSSQTQYTHMRRFWEILLPSWCQGLCHLLEQLVVPSNCYGLPWCRFQSLQSLSNFTFTRETRYAPGIYLNVHFKLFMHVSQRSPEAVPMYPMWGVHWDSWPIPIKWSSANDSAAQV